MLFNVSMPKTLMKPTMDLLLQDPDLVFYLINYLKINFKLRVTIIDTDKFSQPPESCDLEFILKPPAYRQSVENLRLNKQMSHVAALKIFKKTEAEYRNIPKSYFIPLSRH